MAKKAGLWIDHRKTIVVFLEGEGEEIKIIESNIERHARPPGGSRSRTRYGPQDVAAEDNEERKFLGQLKRYYDEVISCLHDVKSILIFGPGEAKVELKKQIERKKTFGKIAGIETADKMTQHQITEKVKKFFLS